MFWQKQKNIVGPQIRDCKEYRAALITLQGLVKNFIDFRTAPIMSGARLVVSSHIANSVLNLCKALRAVEPSDLAVIRIQKIAERYLKEVLK